MLSLDIVHLKYEPLHMSEETLIIGGKSLIPVPTLRPTTTPVMAQTKFDTAQSGSRSAARGAAADPDMHTHQDIRNLLGQVIMDLEERKSF